MWKLETEAWLLAAWSLVSCDSTIEILIFDPHILATWLQAVPKSTPPRGLVQLAA